MKNNTITYIIIALIIIVGLFYAVRLNTYPTPTPVEETPATTTTDLPATTTPSEPTTKTYTGNDFTIQYPSDFSVDENYSYTNLGPNKTIKGVKFTIPASMTAGTNLSDDTYISVEHMSQTGSTCSATNFTFDNSKASTTVDNGVRYSYAKTSDAGAGNRYEESVYTLLGNNPCVTVRYFVHYGNIGNYPAGTVKEFDAQALMAQFDTIRRSLVVGTR